MTDISTPISNLPQASSAGTSDDLVINTYSGSAYTTQRIVLSAFKSSIFNAPTLVTPTLGVATATSINGNTITASSGTLTLGAGKTFTASNTLTFTGTDGSSVAFGTGGTVLYSGGAYVSSLAGTANEITASAATGAVTLSIPTAVTFTGKTVTGGTFASPTISGTVAGAHTYSGALTLSAAMTYGGVTLSNAVTGTGNMVLSASPTITGTLAAAAITATGTITPSQTNGIVGTTTNNSANAGSVGEYVESIIAVGSPVAFSSSGTAQNLTSISLTAGDWDVEGLVTSNPTVATTGNQAGINTTTNTMPVGGLTVTVVGSSSPNSIVVPRRRISIASTTTVYLVANLFFGSGTCGMYGYINARRVR